MLTALRLHERQRLEATGQAAPAPPPPTEVPWHQHQAELVALEQRLRAELARPDGEYTVQLNVDEEPFKSAVEALVAELEAKAKEALDAAAAQNAELQGKLTEALAKVAELEAKAKEAEAKGPKPKAR